MAKRKKPAAAPVAPAVVAPSITPLPDPEGAGVMAKIKAARDSARSRMTGSSYGGKPGIRGGTVKTAKPVATGGNFTPLGG